MSTDYQLVAVKKPWVPEWLWSIVKHVMPIAWLLVDRPGCEWPDCSFAATCLLDGERRCDDHTPPPPPPRVI